MATLGQKLRELRHQKGFKLNEVAEGADLSISFISLIERDKASISVENLQKLANFYQVKLFQIFQDIEEEEAYIIQHEKITNSLSHEAENLILYRLSPDDNPAFTSVYAVLPSISPKKALIIKKGEAFIFVKKGSLTINLANKSPQLLRKDDTAHITGFKGATLLNNEQDTATEIILIASPPTQFLNILDEPLKLHALE